ncbi:transcriptional protein SWT1-like isoform X2 [Myxocyprinus asiaticus]|uniref:transcriptional protein SWT1-like isoform X2 n=1 Tax=Myxocyprinus asiaticus TaxID=70543 RepID=UPI002223211C|nr:transcriptional protein SWT1-like isoform X2 [Myxocyprinus asiaticus]
MSSKKSKKKKQKNEGRISSSSSSEDERKERDTKRLSSPKNKQHRRHESSEKDEAKGRRVTNSPSTRKDTPKKGRREKTVVEKRKSKDERSPEGKATANSWTVFKSPITQEKERVIAKRKHENASPHVSGRSSSRHVATNQLSSKELKEQRQKLVSRRSASEEPIRKPARDDSSPEELQEKRRKVMKRSLSPEFHSEAKRRDIIKMTSSNLAHTDSQSDILKEMRKKLVGRRSKEIDQTVSAKKSSHGKMVNDHSKKALPVLTHVDSGAKLKLPKDISQKQQDCTKHHVQSKNAPATILKEEKSSSCPMPKVSFKITKKASAIKAQTKTDIWNMNLDSSDSRTRCNSQSSLPDSVAADSPSTLLMSQQRRQRPQNVSAQTSNKPSSFCSSHSLYLSQVQQLQIDKTEATTPSKTPCKADHITPHKDAETFDSDHEMQLVKELYLARSERRLEVNLVESCGELTCMDIDPPEEGASMTFDEEQHKQDLLIVLDTNVLLSHLDFVKKIRSHGLGALGFPTLLIPWVVLQELDSLKSGRLSSKVEDKARPAVHYIYCCLKNQEPRLMGQSMQLASQAVCEPGVVNNDDRVLQCCLQYQALYPEGALVLCTNDKNLCSKALFSGVKALNKADLEVEGTRPTIVNYTHAHPIVLPSAGPVSKEKEGTQERMNSAVEKRVLSECVSALESCLQGALSEVLEEEMKAAFGDLWLEIVYVKPPWSLDGILQCFKKHWIAVFGNIIKRNLLSCVKSLSDCLCSDRPIEHISVLNAVRKAAELLSALAGRSRYSVHMDQALSTLHVLQQRLQFPQASKEGEDSEDTLMAEIEEGVAPSSQTLHEEVWAMFEFIWNNVCQISSALFSALHYTPGTTEPSLPPTSPLPQEALSCLQRLSTAIRRLLEALQRLLSVNSSVEDAQSLLSIIQVSEIAALEPRFTARDLFDCFSQQEYREKLCVGCSQLSELTANLDRCAAALSSWP